MHRVAQAVCIFAAAFGWCLHCLATFMLHPPSPPFHAQGTSTSLKRRLARCRPVNTLSCLPFVLYLCLLSAVALSRISFLRFASPRTCKPLHSFFITSSVTLRPRSFVDLDNICFIFHAGRRTPDNRYRLRFCFLSLTAPLRPVDCRYNSRTAKKSSLLRLPALGSL